MAMKILHPKILGAAAMAAAMAFAVPASAQQFGITTPQGSVQIGPGGVQFHGPQASHGRIGVRELTRNLRSQGYRDIRIVGQTARTYQVRAESRNRDYMLTVNAFSGRIIDRDRIGPPPRPGQRPGHPPGGPGWGGPGWGNNWNG